MVISETTAPSSVLNMATRRDPKTLFRAARELSPKDGVGHSAMRVLIALADGVGLGGDEYVPRVKVLCEFVKRGCRGARPDEISPKAREIKMDLFAVGSHFAARKQELVVA